MVVSLFLQATMDVLAGGPQAEASLLWLDSEEAAELAQLIGYPIGLLRKATWGIHANEDLRGALRRRMQRIRQRAA